MIRSLRNRLLVIGILALLSGVSLWQNYRRTAGPDRPGQPVNLGLDIQGGMHLTLELNQSERVSADPARDIDLALTVLRNRMNEFGVAERVIQKAGHDRIVVELPGLRDPARAREIIRRTAYLEFRLTDRTDGLLSALPAMDRAMGGLLAGRIHPAAVTGLAPIPGEYAVRESEWRQVDSLLRLPEVRRLWPRGVELKWLAQPAPGGEYRSLYALEAEPVITGSSLVNAQAGLDPLTQQAEVRFELDQRGARRFGQVTASHVGDYLAILLDGSVQGRPPVIESRIDRQGRIQLSGRSIAEAQDLALTLRAGALPTPLDIVEERQVGPSLGADSIRGGIVAGLTGIALVVLVMTSYYALSGVLAVAALGFYTLFTFGALAALGADLTLPGFAGFVLSIGLAVDANVLIFERIREERAAGRAPGPAVDQGFRHALPAIIDSNVTTVLTALFLYRFGTGPVQGFAVTLILGILASMVTAVFVTRTFYLIWLRLTPEDGRLSLGRVRLFQHVAYDFLAARKAALLLTGAILLAGAGAFLLQGVRSSVEFTGGTLIRLTTASPVEESALRGELRTQGIEGAEIQRFGSDRGLLIRAGALKTADRLEGADRVPAAVAAALDQVAGRGNYEIARVEAVGPKVGAELRTQAALAVLLSFSAVLAYLAWRFEWRFGVAAVVATAHDILATIAFVVLLRLEVSLVVVAAILTVLGYSLNDTIVIFDRLRENLRSRSGTGLPGLINRSVNETLPRTVLTGGTALATLVALAVFGGEVIRPFALVLFFGILVGTFSSIFIAAPALLAIERRWPGIHRASGGRATLSGTPRSEQGW